VIDKDETVTFSLNGNDGLPERLEAFDDFNAVEERPVSLSTALVSLGFIRGALRRAMLFWCALALLGLVIGIGVYIKFPPAYKASTSVLITYGPEDNPPEAVLDLQAIAESRTVAEMAMRKLGVHESVSSFVAATTVTIVTTRVLQITVSAPTSDEAVSRATAVAAAFLQLRASELETTQKLLLQTLQNQLSHDQKSVAAINSQINQLDPGATSADLAASAGLPTSSPQAKKLKSLENQLTQAQSAVAVDQGTIAETIDDTGTLSAIHGSTVLDPALPLAHSKLKNLLIYPVIGLLAGLAVGMGLVVVRAIITDRLRRRDDVTHALGAPVKLSVDAVPLSRWRSGRSGLAATGSAAVQRITSYLRAAEPRTIRGAAALAVIPVDDPDVAALSAVSLAVSRAREGRSVVVADLASGAPVATRLHAKAPGVRSISVHGVQLALAVPDRDDLAPVGPVGQAPADAQHSEFTAAVRNACASADLLVTVATIDPSIGAEHIATWATSAVAVVTAGRSSWARIHAAGEMMRLAGLPLASAVLVGADRTDESLGVTERSSALSGRAGLGQERHP
jgi:capsular polysaccharide biosynthesis protein